MKNRLSNLKRLPRVVNDVVGRNEELLPILCIVHLLDVHWSLLLRNQLDLKCTKTKFS